MSKPSGKGELGEVRCSRCGNGYRYKLENKVLKAYRAQLPLPERALKKGVKELSGRAAEGIGKGIVEVFFDFLSGRKK